MSNLSENSIWEPVVNQVETGEAITGGVGGRANIATGQLLNRTKYLKDVVDTTVTDVNNLTTDVNNLTSRVDNISDWTIVSAPATMTDTLEKIILDEGITFTLKATPVSGDTLRIAIGGDWETSNSTIARNGSNIMSLGEDLIIDKNIPFGLVYKDAISGWVLY